MSSKKKDTTLKAKANEEPKMIAGLANAVIEPAKEKAKENVKEAPKSKETPKAKETASKTKETASKATKKAEEVKSYVEFSGDQFSVEEITENAKKHWQADHSGTISTISVYINTDQRKVYYVVNNDDRGDFNL